MCRSTLPADRLSSRSRSRRPKATSGIGRRFNAARAGWIARSGGAARVRIHDRIKRPGGAAGHITPTASPYSDVNAGKLDAEFLDVVDALRAWEASGVWAVA